MGGGGKWVESEAEAKAKEDKEFFNAGQAPPFRIVEIRNAIPKHCWMKDPWRSMSYVFRDVAIVVALAGAAAYANSWVVWPLYWLVQGTIFWALFVLGHDCGHGSFSDSPLLNNVVGHVLHSFILIPYNGWRISHRKHHQNHGNVEKDESWCPTTEKTYRTLDERTLKWRYTLPYPLFTFPRYLTRIHVRRVPTKKYLMRLLLGPIWATIHMVQFYSSPGKTGSHFNPKNSELFLPNDWLDVVISTTCWAVMFASLVVASWFVGPLTVLKIYGVPYVINVMWFGFVTYLHHHGHHEKLPWYRGQEWTYLRGALSTVDRDYGWINKIHHNIETHLVHHLFPQIPHYHLTEATKAAKPVLGKYYREPEKSGPLPFHLFGILARSLRVDHFVSDHGDVVYYQSDPRLVGDDKVKSM